MIQAEFKWKSHVKEISVKPGPKQYGFYKKGGEERFRNYHRELKNGKGVSLVEIIQWRVKKMERQMAESFRKIMIDLLYPELPENDVERI